MVTKTKWCRSRFVQNINIDIDIELQISLTHQTASKNRLQKRVFSQQSFLPQICMSVELEMNKVAKTHVGVDCRGYS